MEATNTLMCSRCDSVIKQGEEYTIVNGKVVCKVCGEFLHDLKSYGFEGRLLNEMFFDTLSLNYV